MPAPHGSDDDRVADLFARAIVLPPDRRRQFLEEQCRGDARLLAELSSLVASHETAPDFLEQLGGEVLPPALGALDAALDPVGQVVGRYEILGRIGRGGMGDVFQARDTELGRLVALKFLPAHLASDGPGRERLVAEAKVASSLDHPNIAVVYEVGTAPPTSGNPKPRTFLAMAYCGSETLADELARHGRLPLGRVLELGIQLADALSSAHEAGIVHRDVKPGNLILTERGSLKLVDFGLALLLGDRGPVETRSGTLAYMSPELLGGGTVDHRADVWAAGVVLYEMLTGSRPFQGTTAEAMACSVRETEPTPVRDARPDVPPRLADVVQRCLAKDPLDRYGSATALLTELRTVADTRRGREETASIVVVPFEVAEGDRGNEVDEGDGELEYLGAGVAEEIIDELARVQTLRVIARASSRYIRSGERDSATVARELGVRYVLQGILQVEDGALQLSASLTDTRTDARLGLATFQGTLHDLHRLRREVARAVIDALELSTVPHRQPVPSLPSAETRAYEVYLRARYESWRFSAEGLARARRYIESGLEILGDDDLLLGALGHITAMEVESGLGEPPDKVREVSRAADRALALNPRSAQGFWLKSWAAFRRGGLHDAIRFGEHAHALDPENADVLLLLGYVYVHAERNADGRALLERALLLDPLTPLTHAVQGFLPVMEGRFDDAVGPYERGVEMDPDSPFSATFHGWALAYAGRMDEAIEAYGAVTRRFPGTPFAAYSSAMASALDGRRDETVEAITPALSRLAEHSEMFARELAHCYALVDEKEDALAWLERAVDLGMWNHSYLAEHDWFLESVRPDPRFTALLERVRAARESLWRGDRDGTSGR